MQDEEERRLEATEEPDGSIMEFRLTYDGELKSATKSKGRVEHKHDIRRVFHRQMRSVWATHPALGPVNTQRLWEREDFMRYHRDGFKWLPLVLKNQFMICELDVLILRRGRPGNFITQGDIDGNGTRETFCNVFLADVTAALRDGAVDTLIVGELGDATVVADAELTMIAPVAMPWTPASTIRMDDPRG